MGVALPPSCSLKLSAGHPFQRRRSASPPYAARQAPDGNVGARLQLRRMATRPPVVEYEAPPLLLLAAVRFPPQRARPARDRHFGSLPPDRQLRQSTVSIPVALGTQR